MQETEHIVTIKHALDNRVETILKSIREFSDYQEFDRKISITDFSVESYGQV